MSAPSPDLAPRSGPLDLAADLMRRLLLLLAAALPLLPIAYLQTEPGPARLFDVPGFHELAIGVATVQGSFLWYVSWCCYRGSGEPFARWLSLAFGGFTLIYSLHGLFTPFAPHHLALFLLYGPAARAMMGLCLLLAVLRFHADDDPPARRIEAGPWLRWLALFLAINLGVGLVAHGDPAQALQWRLRLEAASGLLCGAALVALLWRQLRSPLMRLLAAALVLCTESSLAFALSRTWDATWWYAHLLSASGISALGYGVLSAYLNGQGLARVFGRQALAETLGQTHARLRRALEEQAIIRHDLEAQVGAAVTARRQFEQLFELAPDGILLVDPAARVLRANAQAEAMFGYGAGELTGLPLALLVPAEARERHARQHALFKLSNEARPMAGVDRALPGLRRDGSTFDALISIAGLSYDGQTCHLTFVREASPLLAHEAERRRVDAIAIARGQLLEQVAALLPLGVFEFSRSAHGRYRFTYVGARAAEQLGCPADVLRQDGSAWFRRVDPADLPSIVLAIENAAAQGSAWSAIWSGVEDRGGLPPRRWVLHTSAPRPDADRGLLWAGYLRPIDEPGQAPPEGV